jgi:anti-sigma factor RsiW
MARHFTQHPDEDRWEQYALGLLSEEQIAEMEEHLLVCPDCQDRLAETDAYIYAVRQAARNLQRKPPSGWRCVRAQLERWMEAPVVPWAVAAAAVLALFLLVPRLVLAPRSDVAAAMTIMLHAARSSGEELFAQAPAGRVLRLEWEPSGLPSESCCQVEVVDAEGRLVAEARLNHPAESALRLRPLRPGAYWVRLYVLKPDKDLVREFGLKVR